MFQTFLNKREYYSGWDLQLL